MRILQIVSMNGTEVYIVDQRPKMLYKRVQHNMLLGQDGVGGVDVLLHRHETYGPKAFGGHELEFEMEDGTTLKSDGWWWQGDSKLAHEYIDGCMHTVNRGYATVGEYVDIPVFRAMSWDLARLDAMRQAYFNELAAGTLVSPTGQSPCNYWSLDRAARKLKSQLISEGSRHSMDLDPDELIHRLVALYEA